MNVVVAGLGTATLAAMMIVFQLNSVSFMPASGLATAGAILVGQAIGADRKDLVPRAVGLTFVVTALWQGLVGLSYVIAPALLFAPFLPAAQERATIVAVGSGVLALSAGWQLFDAAVATFGEALRAAGDTAFAMWARIVVAWAVLVPGSYLAARHLGWTARGATLWLILYMALLAAVLFGRLTSGAWRRLELTKSAGVT